MAAFRIYRILCSTPPSLESERRIFESVLTSFVEQVTMPQQVLFAGASFPPVFDADLHRAPAEENVRMCDFFLHMFSGSWPGDAFQAFIELAQASQADPSRPMRQVAVLFQNFAEADEKVHEYRTILASAGNWELRDFQDSAGLEGQIREILTGWWESVQAKP